MRRVALIYLLGLALTWMGSDEGRAAGLIIVHEPDFWRPPPALPPPEVRPPIRPSWAPLETSFTKVETKIEDQVARTRVAQEFYNPNPRSVEGTFLFPVPKGAHLDKFSMEIDGRPVEAELLQAKKARSVYEDIVRKLKDPALLEYADRDLFKVRIFPIEAHGKKTVTLAYTEVLPAESGVLAYRFPLGTEKHSAKPLSLVSFKVEIESSLPLKSIYSPSHEADIRRHGERRATIGFEETHVTPEADFQLFITREEGEFGLSLLTHRTGEDDGYFLLLAAPGMEWDESKILPKDVVFVLDTSGSMSGAKLAQAKKALRFCVENLNERDRFEVLRFSTEVEPLFDGLAEVRENNRARALGFLKNLRALGGTAIDLALRQALALRPDHSERPFVVIFLTDGRPTVGQTSENKILEGVTRNQAALTRVFCFGIGTDVNTHLLDRITESTRAVSQYVLPEEDIEVKLSNFFTKIKEPVLADPELVFPEGVRVTKLYPHPLPDLFKGEQLVLAGRYSGHGNGKIKITGKMAGERRRFGYHAAFPSRSTEHEFIPRLWATRRVGYLLDEIRLHGENAEVKEEVIDLARQYGIVTPYTAYLIVEDEQRRGIAQNQQSLSDAWYSSGVRRQLSNHYQRFAQDRSGDAAVGGARSLNRLKSAEAAPTAIGSGNEEALRPLIAAPAVVTTAPSRQTTSGALAQVEDASRTNLATLSQQTRFLGGRTFYLKANQWQDAELQRFPNAKPVRIQFGSDAYFAWLKDHPEAAEWLALGRHVRFVLAETVYEIYE